MGGVCPFAVSAGAEVFLDVSLKRFETVFPACGSSSSAIELTIPELERFAGTERWVDVCNVPEQRFKPVRASADLTQCDADALVQKSIENLAFGEDFDHLLPVVYHLYGIIAVIGQPAQKPAGRQVGISGEYTGAG